MTRLTDSDWAILRESEADARCFEESARPPLDLDYEVWAELLAAELPPQELPGPTDAHPPEGEPW